MIAIRNRAEMADPNICKVVVDSEGRALYFTRAPVPYNRDSWLGDNLSVEKGESATVFKSEEIATIRKRLGSEIIPSFTNPPLILNNFK